MPDLADALDADGLPGQAGITPEMIGGRAHALENAERGEDGGVTGPAVRHGPAGHVGALARDDIHVLAVRADVARGDVAAVQRLDEPAVSAEQGLGLELGRIPDDHCLAAAEVEPGQRVLVGHGSRQVQRIG